MNAHRGGGNYGVKMSAVMSYVEKWSFNAIFVNFHRESHLKIEKESTEFQPNGRDR